jgi:hypothetical protein
VNGSVNAIKAGDIAGAGNAFDGSRWAYGLGAIAQIVYLTDYLAPLSTGQLHARFSVMARDYPGANARVIISYSKSDATAAAPQYDSNNEFVIHALEQGDYW